MVNALEDEMMPPTPPPRLLTPLAGVPSIATRDPASAEHAVQAILQKESSEAHRETRFLFGFSAKAARKKRALQPGPILVDPRHSLYKVVRAGTKPLSPPRRWRGMVGAGLALALGFFAVWMAMGGSITAQTTARCPATNPKVPSGSPIENAALPNAVSTATIVPVAVPAPSPVFPASPGPSTPAPVKPSRPTAHPMHTSRAKSAAPRAGRLSADDF
jgi:hypothetical protein